MTSPDGSVPSGAYTGGSGTSNISSLQQMTEASARSIMSTGPFNAYNGAALNSGNLVKAAGDEGMAALCRAVAGIDILGFEPFAFMNSWADNLDRQAQQALSTGNTALATANSAVTSITTQQTQTSTGGNSVTLATFPPNLSGSLGTTSSWTLLGTSGSSSQVQWGTDGNGNAKPVSILNTGNYTALLMAVNGQLMATDTHQATTVVGVAPLGGDTAASGVFVRATSNCSSFVFAVADYNQVQLGYATLVSGTLSATPWQTVNWTVNTGDTLQLSAHGTVYTVYVNGSPVTSATDSGGSSPVGASNRYVGMLTGQQVVTTVGGSTVLQGWAMSSFNAADTISPPVIGTGWTMSQQGSGAVSLPGSGGWSTFGSGAFDTIQINGNKVPNYNLATGAVTIPVTGWYVLSVSARLSSSCGTGYVFQTGVYRTPAGGGTKSLAFTGQEACGDPVHRTQCCGVLFCTQGDVVQAAVYQAGTNSTVGDGTPDETYFSGTLCSFN